MEKKKAYLRNVDLLEEFNKSKEQGKMTNEFARMLMLLTDRYSKKANFARYTYLEDMKSWAILSLVRTWESFDPTVGLNAFAFYTKCIHNSFVQYLNVERKERDIRDHLCVEHGIPPSFTYSDAESEKNHSHEHRFDMSLDDKFGMSNQQQYLEY